MLSQRRQWSRHRSEIGIHLRVRVGPIASAVGSRKAPAAQRTLRSSPRTQSHDRQRRTSRPLLQPSFAEEIPIRTHVQTVGAMPACKGSLQKDRRSRYHRATSRTPCTDIAGVAFQGKITRKYCVLHLHRPRRTNLTRKLGPCCSIGAGRKK